MMTNKQSVVQDDYRSTLGTAATLAPAGSNGTGRKRRVAPQLVRPAAGGRCCVGGVDLSTTYVVVPAYNEQEVIDSVLRDLLGVVESRRIIVVDDGSEDHTYRIARSRNVTTLRHLINRGQGAALVTGIEYALGKTDAQVIVTFDGDGQHKACEIPEMIRPILEGRADVVLGSRFLGKEPTGICRSRIFTLKMGVIFTRLVSDIKVSDCHNGFRALSREAARKIRISQDGMTHASELLDEITRNRLHFIEQPVQIRYTDYSQRKGQRSGQALNLGIKFLVSRLTK